MQIRIVIAVVFALAATSCSNTTTSRSENSSEKTADAPNNDGASKKVPPASDPEQAKFNQAKLKAANIVKAAKTYCLKNGKSIDGLSLQALVKPPKPLLEGGENALLTPYGEPFLLALAEGKDEDGVPNFEVYFQRPDGRYDSKGNKQ